MLVAPYKWGGGLRSTSAKRCCGFVFQGLQNWELVSA